MIFGGIRIRTRSAIQVGRNEPLNPIFSTLEQRIAALLSEEQCGEDLDAASWVWAVLLGVGVPALMLLIGWWA